MAVCQYDAALCVHDEPGGVRRTGSLSVKAPRLGNCATKGTAKPQHTQHRLQRACPATEHVKVSAPSAGAPLHLHTAISYILYATRDIAEPAACCPSLLDGQSRCNSTSTSCKPGTSAHLELLLETSPLRTTQHGTTLSSTARHTSSVAGAICPSSPLSKLSGSTALFIGLSITGSSHCAIPRAMQCACDRRRPHTHVQCKQEDGFNEPVAVGVGSIQGFCTCNSLSSSRPGLLGRLTTRVQDLSFQPTSSKCLS